MASGSCYGPSAVRRRGSTDRKRGRYQVDVVRTHPVLGSDPTSETRLASPHGCRDGQSGVAAAAAASSSTRAIGQHRPLLEPMSEFDGDSILPLEDRTNEARTALLDVPGRI